jgi:hypothetical protein
VPEVQASAQPEQGAPPSVARPAMGGGDRVTSVPAAQNPSHTGAGATHIGPGISSYYRVTV